jgi:hypothetical protein
MPATAYLPLINTRYPPCRSIVRSRDRFGPWAHLPTDASESGMSAVEEVAQGSGTGRRSGL